MYVCVMEWEMYVHALFAQLQQLGIHKSDMRLQYAALDTYVLYVQYLLGKKSV